MQYFISFLEGIITFVSPCLLPMLPIYISYFAGGNEQNTKQVLKNAIGFICGFTTVFVLLGALAGTLGNLLREYDMIINIIAGLIVIFFGLNFLGIFKLNIFKGARTAKTDNLGFFSSVLFGMIFSISWTPCIGTFLGSALMLAASQKNVLQGIMMLLLYSLGLGIPFFISAILINRLKNTFTFIKKNYNIINLASGILLIIVGVLMATGLLGQLIALMS